MTIGRFAIIPLALLVAATIAAAAPMLVKDLSVLEQKIYGSWKGQGGCTGEIDFRTDGSYEWRHYGPVNATRAGKWEVRWDALPPTLVLTLDTSKIKAEAGKTLEMKITLLDDSSFTFEPEDKPSSFNFRYLRRED